MNNLRMTAEELNELKPSYDNPVNLVCDDGYYTGSLDTIYAISRANKEGRFCAINASNLYAILDEGNLKHYPSLKKEKVKKKYWLFMNKKNGRITEKFYDKLGESIDGEEIGLRYWVKSNCFVEVEVEE